MTSRSCACGTAGHAIDQAGSDTRCQPPLSQLFGQIAFRAILHDQVGSVVVRVARIEDLNDPWMVHAGGQQPFAVEAALYSINSLRVVGWLTFSATRRWQPSWIARNTAPIPPTPSCARQV